MLQFVLKIQNFQNFCLNFKKIHITPQNHTIQWFQTPKMAYIMRFDTPSPIPLGMTGHQRWCYVFPPTLAWSGLKYRRKRRTTSTRVILASRAGPLHVASSQKNPKNEHLHFWRILKNLAVNRLPPMLPHCGESLKIVQIFGQAE